LVDVDGDNYEETLQDLQIKLERVNAYVKRSEMKIEKYEKELNKIREIKQKKELSKLLTLDQNIPKIQSDQ